MFFVFVCLTIFDMYLRILTYVNKYIVLFTVYIDASGKFWENKKGLGWGVPWKLFQFLWWREYLPYLQVLEIHSQSWYSNGWKSMGILDSNAPVNGIRYNPYKWPKINGFHWCHFTLLIGVSSPHLKLDPGLTLYLYRSIGPFKRMYSKIRVTRFLRNWMCHLTIFELRFLKYQKGWIGISLQEFLLLVEEILHQLRLVVYQIIYKVAVFAPQTYPKHQTSGSMIGCLGIDNILLNIFRRIFMGVHIKFPNTKFFGVLPATWWFNHRKIPRKRWWLLDG